MFTSRLFGGLSNYLAALAISCFNIVRVGRCHCSTVLDYVCYGMKCPLLTQLNVFLICITLTSMRNSSDLQG